MSLSQEDLVLKEQAMVPNGSCHTTQNDFVNASFAAAFLKEELEASIGLLAWCQNKVPSWNFEESSVNVYFVEEDRLRNSCEVWRSVVNQFYR